MTITAGKAIVVMLLALFAASGAASDRADLASLKAELRAGVDKDNYERAFELARRLFYSVDRTSHELKKARQTFELARQFAAPNNLRVCEFWVVRLDFKRAETHCLRAVEEDEYLALMALAHIYEFGSKETRNPAHAYSCYLLVAQIKQGELYELAQAGKKRVGRTLSRAERRQIDKQAGAGWSLF